MKLQEQYVGFAYYTNRLIDCTRRLMAKNYRRMRKHLKFVAEEQAGMVKGVCEDKKALA